MSFDSFDIIEYCNRPQNGQSLPEEKEYLEFLAARNYLGFRQSMMHINEGRKKTYEDYPELQKRRAEEEIERQENPEKYQAKKENSLKIIRLMLSYCETIEFISKILNRPIKEITAFVKEIEDKDREETDLKRNHI